MSSSLVLQNRMRAYEWRSRLPLLGVVCFLLVLALQIPYPLLSTSGQRPVTIASVVAFFGASAVHAWWSRGWTAVGALVGVCVLGGLAVEAVGWRSGFPFGNYRYTGTLGWKILGVPIVVTLAWAMFGWLAFLCAAHVGGRAKGALIGGVVLMAWDLFLDPQMVRSSGWVWRDTVGPELNGIPVVNFLGWFVVGSLMVGALLRLVPLRKPDRFDDLGWWLLGWTLFSETLLFAWFFHRPSVALIGTPVMSAALWSVWALGRKQAI